MIWLLRALLVLACVGCATVTAAYVGVATDRRISLRATFRAAFYFAAPFASFAFLAGAWLLESWR